MKMTKTSQPFCYHQILNSPQMGGAGLVALQLAQRVRERGHVGQVWIPGQGPIMGEALGLGLSVQCYDSRAAFSPSRLRSISANWLIGRRLRRFGPGIAHIHSPYFYRVLRVGLWLGKVRTVAHVHSEENADGLRWSLQNPPDLIVTCARFLVDHVRRNLPDRCQGQQAIAAVPNAVDTDRFRPGDKAEAKRLVGAPGEVPLVLMLANLAPFKGQETAIHATALLITRGIKVICWLAGTERDEGGSYTSKLRTLIRTLGVEDCVQLLGQRSDAPDLLRAADFFLLPSTTEGLPLSILEAQATKVPVLASAAGGVTEIVHDQVTGFLIPQADVEGYARRIENLLTHRNLSDGVAHQAYIQATRKYNWGTYFAQMMDLYQSLHDQVLPRRSGMPSLFRGVQNQ